MAETVARRVRRIAAKKACPARFAGDASAAQDAGRWDAIHGLHQEVVRDCRWEAGRDFLSVMAELERQVLPQHWDELESRLAQRLPGERLRVVSRPALSAVQAQQVAPLWARPLARADESELPQAQLLPARQASQLVVRPPVRELASLALPGALRARLAWPLAPRQPQVRSVSMRLVLRSIVEAPLVQQASSGRLSPPLPSSLFLLWRLLPLVLLLRPRPESFCAPFPQRPRELSSNASSFP